MTTSTTGPLIPRRRLGAAFRELREARGETLQQTAKALMFSPSKLSRIENGLAGEPHPRDVRDLIAHFEAGPDQAARLEELADEGRLPGWWQMPPYQMPSRLDTFISYESAASRIEAYVPTVVPGLLQTHDYASAVLHRLVPHLTPREVEHQADIRIRRQRELRQRESPPTSLYVMPETVLHRRVGSPQTMREQLDVLISAYDDPSLDLHVIPFTAGLYEAVELSNMNIFLFADDSDCDVVAIERVRFVDFLDRPQTVAKYRAILNGSSDCWLDRSESREFIIQVRDTISQES